MVAAGADQRPAGRGSDPQVELVHHGRVAGLTAFCGAFYEADARSAEWHRLSEVIGQEALSGH